MTQLATDAPGRLRSGRPAAVAYLVVAIALVALNLRPALVAVGPLTEQLRADTGLTAAAVSLLTTLPLLCLAVLSNLAPRFARRTGLEWALTFSAALLVAGCAVRLIPSIPFLYAGAAIVGVGIAIGNVLVPVVIKQDLPDRVGPMMAVYSVMLSLGAAVAAGISVPLGRALSWGWRPTLALWALPAAVALVLWLPLALRAGAVAGEGGSAPPAPVWRSRVAWAVASFMGLQSLIFYALAAWMPTMLQDAGLSESSAGLMVGALSASGILAAFAIPVLAARARDQRAHALLCTGLIAIGVVGLLVAPGPGALAWAVVLGLGLGGSISLAVTLFVLRSRTASGAGALSGMAQSVGYALAAAGPLLVGVLHDVSGGWTLPLIALGVVVLLQGLAGLGAGADHEVDSGGAGPAVAVELGGGTLES